MGRKKKQDAGGVATAERPVAVDETGIPLVIPRRLKADLVLVPLTSIVSDGNDRTSMDEGKMLQLQGSMQSVGLMEPLVVRKRGKEFVLIAGARRLEAARRNGEDLVEAKVYGEEVDDRLASRMRLTENLQREDLNHIDIALALGRARDSGMNVKQIAEQINASDDYVRKHLDLLRLCEPVRQLVASGRLPLKHAEYIARVGDHDKQIEIAGGAIDKRWDAKASAWKSYHWDEDPSLDDTLHDASSVRDNVARAMLGMAACGWPMDEEFAGKQPCRGCPDNSQTYAGEPALFAGIRPQGSDKKGHCTNEACYLAKEKAWDKVRAARKREEEKKLTSKIKTAQKQGLPICEGCSRVLKDGESLKEFTPTDQKLCPTCFAKATKKLERGSGRGGLSWEQQQKMVKKQVKELEKKFPWTAEQKFALALWAYGCDVGKRLSARLKIEPLPADATAVALRVMQISDGGFNCWGKERAKAFAALTADLGKSDPVSVSSKLLVELLPSDKDIEDCSPGISEYNATVLNVPLHDDTAETIVLMEALCRHWSIEIPQSPRLGDFPDAPAETPAAEKKPEKAKRGVCRMCGKGEPKKPYSGTWWRDVPKLTLCKACDPDNIFGTIFTHSEKAVGQDFIAGCTHVAALQAALAFGMRDDWRREAVERRLGELQTAPLPLDGEKATEASDEPEPGTCHVCGCTEDHACDGGCDWIDDTETLCTACVEAVAVLSKKQAAPMIAILRDQNVLADLVDESKEVWRRNLARARLKELGVTEGAVA